MNLGIGWGLKKERAVEALQREARGVVVGAEMRRRSFRGVVDVIYGGEKPVLEKTEAKGKNMAAKGKEKVGNGNGKRKAVDSLDALEVVDEVEKPPSKRELKRRAKASRKAAAEEKVDEPGSAVKDSTETKEDGDIIMAKNKDQG